VQDLMDPCIVAVGQLTATDDIERNFTVCASFVKLAKEANAKMLFLPENFDYVAKARDQILQLARPLNDKLVQRYQDLARDNKIWISLGGYHELNVAGKMYNTHIIIDSEGKIVSTYRKWHLFDINIPNGPNLKESALTDSGYEQGQSVVRSPVGVLGLSVCYDLRFPEFFRTLTLFHGATVLVVPAAWTFHTGPHWEPLLRARAIENQCYVIAAAQVGAHNEGRRSAGQSMVVDPWGTVIAKSSDKEGIIIATIDNEYLAEVRKNMPVFDHAQKSLYATPGPKTTIT